MPSPSWQSSPRAPSPAPLNVSCDVARELYREINPAFVADWKSRTGEADVGIATEALAACQEPVSFPYFAWSHAIVVPKGHPLETAGRLTLEAIAEWPIITFDAGLTGRPHIDEVFARSQIAPDIVIVARDADVIKTYVELGLGIGIIASIAFSPARDGNLALLEASHLFGETVSNIAVRRGRLLRGYGYRFIELCSPKLAEGVVRTALAPAAADEA